MEGKSMSDYNNIPESYKPISMWGYFGYEVLFSIPVIGFIILLVFAFGGSGNVNVKNFARSYFCLFILFMILALIIIAFAALGGGLAYVSEVM
jgi:hypothetical protein